MNDISTIAANLATQDGRMTSFPIFLVQQKRRIHGLEESDEYIWVSLDTCEEVDEDKAAELEDADYHDHHRDGYGTEGYRKDYYRDEYVFVQPFFTEVGAQRYIDINGHNLREPRIYVESGYRNEEWETIRAHLMALPAPLPILACGHRGFDSIHPAPNGSVQCTDCANKMRGLT